MRQKNANVTINAVCALLCSLHRHNMIQIVVVDKTGMRQLSPGEESVRKHQLKALHVNCNCMSSTHSVTCWG